jgi:hypothetical protein
MAILYRYTSKGSSFKKISDGGKMSIDSNFRQNNQKHQPKTFEAQEKNVIIYR